MTESTHPVLVVWSIRGATRFHLVPSCAWCKAVLLDERGQPAWDLFGKDLTYVCRGGCAPRPARTGLLPKRRRYVRVAA
jgi:hypothetical protein